MTAVHTPVLKIPKVFGSVWNSQKPYQIWFGSRFSSKSWTKAIYFLLKLMSQPYCRVVYARDTQKNVRLSQYQLFKDLEKRFDCFKDQFTFLDSGMKIICKQNGNFMVGGSFEQPDTLRSIADPTDFWAEEPVTRKSQINRQDFLDIAGSLRNPEGVPTQFHFTFNPISKKTWIYEDFFLKKIYGDDVEILKANWYDNPYCPADRKQFLEQLKVIDPERYKVDGEGEWGIAREGQIYKDWITVADSDMPEIQFYGVDFGHTNAAALVAGSLIDVMGQEKNDLYWKELMYETGHNEASLVRRFNDLGVRKDLPMICDSSAPGSISALREAGYWAMPCTKYKGSIYDGIQSVLSCNLKITESSENMIAEASNYCWATNKQDQIMDEPALHSVCHALDGGRYGLESQKKSGSGGLEINEYD